MEIIMKGLLKALLPLVLLLAIAVTMAGCTKDPPIPTGCETHSFDSGTVTKEPSCGVDGVITYTCTICGDTKTESIPATGEHTFGEEAEILVNATCETVGKRAYTCTVCGYKLEEEIPTLEGHPFDEGVVTREPTCYEEGVLLKTCTLCGYTHEETIEIAEAVYTITMKGLGEFLVPESGAYLLPDPEKIGYEFVKWLDSDGEEFAEEGTIDSDITITPVFTLLDTTSVEELEERAAAGAEEIRIVNDIVIDRPIYVTGKTKIYSTVPVKLIRDKSYTGDLFVIGQNADGENSILLGVVAELTLGVADYSGKEIMLTIDGNRDGMEEGKEVVGTAMFLLNSSRVNMYNGVSVSNHRKLGNERLFQIESYQVGAAKTTGGSAAIISTGCAFYMYGGIMDNNAVRTESVVLEDGTSSYLSGYGGSIYNNGTFHMYGGVISDGDANRGGAIYSNKILKIEAGTLEGNYSANKGGAICSSGGAGSDIFIGVRGAEIGTVVFRNNVAGVKGGAILSYANSPIILFGGVLFEGNEAIGNNGGAISTGGPITSYNNKFVGNKAKYSGGAIYQSYGSTENIVRIVELHDTLFEGNSANKGGAITITSAADGDVGSRALIYNCSFIGNSALHYLSTKVNAETGEERTVINGGSGGAIYSSQKSIFDIEDCEFVGNKAENIGGGAITATVSSKINIKNCSFTENAAIDVNGAEGGNAGTGGAIYVYNGTTLSVIESTFNTNTAVKNGGAVYATGAKTTIDNCSFDSNSASSGGAICTSVNSTVTNSTFNKNSASYRGGAFYVVSQDGLSYLEKAVIDNCTFTSNKALEGGSSEERRGGGLYIAEYVVASLKNSIFDGNESTQYGGAVNVARGSVLNVTATNFNNNKASTGGAIWLYLGTSLTVSDGEFSGNSAAKLGGAVYSYETVKYSEITFKNNVASSGGALYVAGGAATVDDCIFTENNASSYGGSIYVADETELVASDVVLSGNTAIRGGAIYVGGGNTTVKNAEFNENLAILPEGSDSTARAGAVFVNSGSLYASNVKFVGNAADNHAGAIVTNTKNAYAYLESVELVGNITSGGNGGAIWLYGGSLVDIKGVVAKGNKAENGYGGVIYITDGSVNVISGKGVVNTFGGEIEGDANAAKSGGAIAGVGRITVDGADFIGNSATSYGGAIYTTSELVISNSRFSGNSAKYFGGAIYVKENGSVSDGVDVADGESVIKKAGSVFISNTAKNGGAIYLAKVEDAEKNPDHVAAIATLEGTVFTSNTATSSGGAIYGSSGSLVSLAGASLTSNSSEEGGAIMLASGSMFTDNASTFNLNIATAGEGGAIHSGGNITLVGTSFTENRADADGMRGGAIYLTAGALVADGISAEGNTSKGNGGAMVLTGAADSRIVNSTFKSNVSGNRAGVIYLNGTVLITAGCEFSENTAVYGGAIYVTTSSNYTDGDEKNAGSLFVSNTANDGGALYSTGKVALRGTEFKSNTASGNASAIYTSNKMSLDSVSVTENVAGGTAAIYVGGGSFSVCGDTTVKDNEGGNVYLKSGRVITVTGALGANASIGVITDSVGDVFANADSGIDVGEYLDRFFYEAGDPIYKTENGEIASGFVIIEQPTSVNKYTVITSGNPTFTWYTWIDGQIHEAVEGQNTAALTSVIEGVTYVCVARLGEQSIVTDPVTYLPTKLHPICGEVCSCVGETHESLEWLPITNTSELISAAVNSGSYYLACDIVLEGSVTVSADVNICLNGKKLTREGDSAFPMLKVSSGATLTLTDCSDYERIGYIDPTTGLWTEESYSGEGIATEYKLYGGVIMGGNAENGGAIYVSGTLNTFGINFAGNTATSNGGAIYVAKNAKAVIENSTFVGNAAYRGGAISIAAIDKANATDSDNLTVNGSVFEYNSANVKEGATAARAGAIYVAEYLKVTVADSIFNYNKAGEYGGAISGARGARITLNGASFNGNTSKTNGGAIWLYMESELNVIDSEFIGNSTTSNGGAIYAYNTLTVSKSSFSGNTSKNGSAIYGIGQLTVSESTLENNDASEHGGAIYVSGTAFVTDSDFTDNEAKNGGAIYVSGEAACAGCTFTGNSASENGGAVYIAANGKYTDGAAVAEGDSVIGATNGSTFTSNTAANGGAICVAITESEAVAGEAVIYGSKFTNNTATARGGAVALLGASAEIYYGIFDGNTANNAGGAIYASAFDYDIGETTYRVPSALTMVGGEVKNGNITGGASSSYYGGGLAVMYGAQAELDGTVFEANSGYSGGAIAVYGSAKLLEDADAGTYSTVYSNLVANNVTLKSNTGNNGAVYLGSYGKATFNGLIATDNATKGSGAVFYVTSNAATTLTVNSATLSGNTAKGNLGFVYMSQAKNVLNICKSLVVGSDVNDNWSTLITGNGKVIELEPTTAE